MNKWNESWYSWARGWGQAQVEKIKSRPPPTPPFKPNLLYFHTYPTCKMLCQLLTTPLFQHRPSAPYIQLKVRVRVKGQRVTGRFSYYSNCSCLIQEAVLNVELNLNGSVQILKHFIKSRVSATRKPSSNFFLNNALKIGLNGAKTFLRYNSINSKEAKRSKTRKKKKKNQFGVKN